MHAQEPTRTDNMEATEFPLSLALSWVFIIRASSPDGVANPPPHKLVIHHGLSEVAITLTENVKHVPQTLKTIPEVLRRRPMSVNLALPQRRHLPKLRLLDPQHQQYQGSPPGQQLLPMSSLFKPGRNRPPYHLDLQNPKTQPVRLIMVHLLQSLLLNVSPRILHPLFLETQSGTLVAIMCPTSPCPVPPLGHRVTQLLEVALQSI